MDNKTSVKVHNPPGGASNFSLGGGYENEAPKKPAATQNKNQESVEENDPSKTSVKVHQQPGGNSNFSLGGYDQPTNNVKTSVKVHQQSHNNIFGGYEEEKPQPKRVNNQHNAHSNIFGGYEEPPKKPAQQQQQQQQQQTQQQEATKTSVKVHNPPGGRSNFTLG